MVFHSATKKKLNKKNHNFLIFLKISEFTDIFGIKPNILVSLNNLRIKILARPYESLELRCHPHVLEAIAEATKHRQLSSIRRPVSKSESQ